MSGNASVLEITWTSLSVLVFVFIMVVTYWRLSDLRYAQQVRDRYWRLRAHIAKGRLYTIFVYLMIQLGFITIGAFAMVAPPPTHPDNSRTAKVLTAVFLIVNVLIASDVVRMVRDRATLADYEPEDK